MDLNCIFWNIGKLREASMIGDISEWANADLVLTAEDKDHNILHTLNQRHNSYRRLLSPNQRGLNYYSNSNFSCSDIEDGLYHSAKCITHPKLFKILIILVHLPSKLYTRIEDQKSFAIQFSAIIKELEQRTGTKQTIVVGDFNSNPHEDAMLSADAFNAVCCPKIAAKLTRTVKGGKYDFFYNPMWKYYTKSDGSGHGTYYKSPSNYSSIYWNIFDQVIFRPSLIENVNVEIIDKFILNGEELNLLNYADHLPIKITIKP